MAQTKLLTARQMEARKNVLWKLALSIKGPTHISVGINNNNTANVEIYRGEHDPICLDGPYEDVRDELKKAG